jgi:hypothetical protein
MLAVLAEKITAVGVSRRRPLQFDWVILEKTKTPEPCGPGVWFKGI